MFVSSPCVCFWRLVDLNYILVEGDKLYELLWFQGIVEELPRQVKIFDRTANLDLVEKNLHDSVAVYGDSFLTSNVRFDKTFFKLIFILFTISILKSPRIISIKLSLSTVSNVL